MNKVIYTLAAILMFGSLSAQINRGGIPISLKSKEISSNVPFYKTDAIDLALAKEQDAVTDQYKETPYRFGIEHEVDLDFFAHATSEIVKENRKVWRLGISCPEAKSVSFLLDQFYLPEGSEMFVYSEDMKTVKGAFNFESNKESGIFPVGLIQSDRIVIEYIEPVSGESANLHIGQIVHGYRVVMNKETQKGPWGTSGPCNININCPEGLPWAEQSRSVVIIIDGGEALCTGAMLNNTLEDETPYFLTADHCLGDPAAWVYNFNHETEGCEGNTGPQDQSVSGGELLAFNSGTDFALIKLSENVPFFYNPFYAGWDNSDALTVTSAVSIHHPNGDLKKICFEEDAPYHGETGGGVAVWWIDEWELGVTEGGSSGSPIFDQNGRVIGQLRGGQAACAGPVNNGSFDYYGRFGVSWDGPNETSRLHDWLDPNASGVTTLDGLGPDLTVFSNDAASQDITNIPEFICDTSPFTPGFILRNQGSNTLTSATIEYTYNGEEQTPIEWSGSIDQSETVIVELEAFEPIAGTNNITATVNNPNGVDDENDANNSTLAVMESPEAGFGSFEITILTDDFGPETSWDVIDENGTVIDSGGDYPSNTTLEFSVPIPSNGCYTFTIYDSAGDGLCCSFGIGEYSVEDANGNLLISGDQFLSTEGGTWAMEMPNGIEEENTAEFAIYPNPAENDITLALSKAIGSYQIDIVNNLGQTVLTKEYNSDMSVNLDVSNLSTGIYTVLVRNETISGAQRITIK